MLQIYYENIADVTWIYIQMYINICLCVNIYLRSQGIGTHIYKHSSYISTYTCVICIHIDFSFGGQH